jgi:REP element-mobilizing transposase RayT
LFFLMHVSKYFVRKIPPHQPPAWVEDGDIFFITLCAKNRDGQPLIRDGVAEQLLNAAIHYHETGRWWARLFLIMPDHVHGLVSVPGNQSLRKVVASWKSYTAKTAKIAWQQDFFDHRPRDLRALQEKEIYILENPVRGGLVKSAEEWPWKFRGYASENKEG